jgi:hypothetical protein
MKTVITIIWKGPIANHICGAILPSWCSIDLQGASVRVTAAQVDVIHCQPQGINTQYQTILNLVVFAPLERLL